MGERPCCRVKSHRELRIHFVPEHWWRLCPTHLKISRREGLKAGWTKTLRSAGGCDIPWCQEKRVHEVYPVRRKIVSYWQPAKKMKGESRG